MNTNVTQNKGQGTTQSYQGMGELSSYASLPVEQIYLDAALKLSGIIFSMNPGFVFSNTTNFNDIVLTLSQGVVHSWLKIHGIATPAVSARRTTARRGRSGTSSAANAKLKAVQTA